MIEKMFEVIVAIGYVFIVVVSFLFLLGLVVLALMVLWALVS